MKIANDKGGKKPQKPFIDCHPEERFSATRDLRFRLSAKTHIESGNITAHRG
jgi:hypothetical protein